MTQRKYLIRAWTFQEATRIAYSFRLSQNQWQWFGPHIPTNPPFDIPKGYRPEGITVLNFEKKPDEILEQKDKEWDSWVEMIYKRIGAKK